VIAILGAGAMGSALAVHWSRHHADVELLATEHDGPAREAWQHHLPHPALGITMPATVPCRARDQWGEALARAELIAVYVSSPGLEATLRRAASWARPDAAWILATKGWQPGSLRSPDLALADRVATSLRSRFLALAQTDDVAGVEVASAYKNVVAIAVGICEGLAARPRCSAWPGPATCSSPASVAVTAVSAACSVPVVLRELFSAAVTDHHNPVGSRR
jgi:glycerol-3-phosphate dehydrogenase